jgi:hypothetical protein
MGPFVFVLLMIDRTVSAGCEVTAAPSPAITPPAKDTKSCPLDVTFSFGQIR